MTPEDYLRRALALAETARGRTAPNPLVGAVLVRDGRIVGEGYHAAAGQPHAERIALASAGEQARGATLYCTLEPCHHQGRTPPCTDAILEAGVAAVGYGLDDPDPRVAGAGAARLRAAGVTVVSGLLREAVAEQLAGYCHHRRTGRPRVIAKWAMTLDGKLATAAGDSRWVSGAAARQRVHELRDRVDAVMIGAGTVVRDNPSLTCRLADFGPTAKPTRHPVRVVVDTAGRTPLTARVYTDGAAETILAVGETRNVPGRPGATVLRLPERNGRVEPVALLTALGERGFLDILCEAGGALTGSLLQAGLVSQVMAVIAPKLIGGRGPSPWDCDGLEPMTAALALNQVRVEQLGDDWVVHGLLPEAE